ncbi:MAG: DUF881 domain-containing protein [Eubacterium sp.]
MKRKGSLAIVLICVLVGILIILQMKTVDQLGGTVDSERAGDLATEVKALDNKNAELNDQLNDLEKQLADYESSAAGADEVVKKKQEALEKERIMAGVVDVTGEGLMITIDADTSKEYDASVYTKGSDLLLALVNELNAAGAEAISINGERIINTSEIRQAGSYININRNKYSAPFEVKVIGKSQDLSAAIKMRAGVVDIMQSNKFKVNITQQNSVVIAAYNGVINFKYAVPAESVDQK